MKHKSARYAGYEFDFSRVNVFLGANGSGKSKLLTEIRDHASTLTGSKKAVYIEGGRTITIKDILQLDVKNFSQFDRYEAAVQHYENKRATSLADRVFDALIVLDKKDAQLKAAHSDAVSAWMEGGGSGQCPSRSQPPLDHLFELFNEIFPQIALTYDAAGRRLHVQKGLAKYGPSALSDGEKQVFSILADLIELGGDHTLVIADEPELNLHPELAERLWTLIENEFPEKTFIYATHSIMFALRENVNKVWVLSSDAENIAEVSGLEDIPRADTAALLGSLPGILSANRVLVTEGHEKSFDAIFYRWLLDDNRLEILPAGGCSDVVSVVEKRGVWSKIASRISLTGVVDADFRDDAYLQSITTSCVHALRFHEAEAYLCLPEVICAIAQRIGSQEAELRVEDVAVVIMNSMERQKLAIAARRVFSLSHITLGVSVEKKVLAAAPTRDALVKELRVAAGAELAKANSKIGPEEVEKCFDEQLSSIEAIIASKDVDQALRYLPAKELLSQLAPRAGCRSGTDLMRSLRHNFKPTGFKATADLLSALKGAVVSGST